MNPGSTLALTQISTPEGWLQSRLQVSATWVGRGVGSQTLQKVRLNLFHDTRKITAWAATAPEKPPRKQSGGAQGIPKKRKKRKTKEKKERARESLGMGRGV